MAVNESLRARDAAVGLAVLSAAATDRLAETVERGAALIEKLNECVKAREASR
ncbi:MAG: hypothetical protein AB7P23_06725 [Amphiplicatus sp.]